MLLHVSHVFLLVYYVYGYFHHEIYTQLTLIRSNFIPLSFNFIFFSWYDFFFVVFHLTTNLVIVANKNIIFSLFFSNYFYKHICFSFYMHMKLHWSLDMCVCMWLLIYTYKHLTNITYLKLFNVSYNKITTSNNKRWKIIF